MTASKTIAALIIAATALMGSTASAAPRISVVAYVAITTGGTVSAVQTFAAEAASVCTATARATYVPSSITDSMAYGMSPSDIIDYTAFSLLHGVITDFDPTRYTRTCDYTVD